MSVIAPLIFRCLLTFIVRLFTPDVRFYEAHHNGNWYSLGFVLHAGIFTGGGILGSRRRRDR